MLTWSLIAIENFRGISLQKHKKGLTYQTWCHSEK